MKLLRYTLVALYLASFVQCSTTEKAIDEPAPQTVIDKPDTNSTDRISVESNGLEIEVSPTEGGRISSLKLNGEEFLSLEDVHPTNWGSTFWVSPQTLWNWPPPVAFDSLPYSAIKTDDGKIILQGATDEQKTGTSFTKTISIDQESPVVSIVYEIKNETDSTISVAPWEITRVPVNGLSFYPGEPGSYTSPFDVEEANGCIWFDYKNSTIQKGHDKLRGSATAGWLAHIDDRLCMLKLFPHSEDFQAAPNEAEIEIYAHPEKLYIELEPQGEIRELLPGEALSWEVNWHLSKLNDDIEVQVGSQGLLDYIESIVSE